MSEEPETTETETASRRGWDGECRVINGMIRDLEELDPDARARVMQYLASRYVKA